MSKDVKNFFRNLRYVYYYRVCTLRINFYADIYGCIFYKYICNIGNETITHSFFTEFWAREI